MTAKVAVWLTNYGNAKHIGQALNSVMAQSHVDFHCYIFDNHSRDGAADTCAMYAREFPLIFTKVEMPEGLAGIPAMKFAWDFLNEKTHKYSITIGGHDFWSQPHFLTTLAERLDAEIAAGNTPALVYTDTWQVNEDNRLVGRFNNILQQGGNMGRPFIPQWVVSGIDCPPFFGMWNEAVRKQVPVRYCCAGWDHMVVTHASCKGTILWEPRVALHMRAPPPSDGLDKYGSRHFSKAALQTKDKDFINQLEWLTECVDEVCEGLGDNRDLYRSMLTASMFSQYICLRGYNLAVFPGGPEAFNQNPTERLAIGACMQAAEAIRKLTGRAP
jgi:hypothetical protein